MKCKHENADHLKPGDLFARSHLTLCQGAPVTVEQFRCLDCGAWLSLGESNDADPAVQVEMRAAEIAADIEQHGGCLMGPLEQAGFLDRPLPLRGGGTIDLTNTEGARAGWLAESIATHDTQHPASTGGEDSDAT